MTKSGSGKQETNARTSVRQELDETPAPSPNALLEGSLAGILCALTVLVLIAVGANGRRSRIEPAPIAAATVVGTSAELLDTWRSSGMRGGTVVYLSRFLHAVPIESAVAREKVAFPVPRLDLVEAHLARVDARNFLWLALEAGIAREIVHVLPPAEYENRRAQLSGGEPGIWLEADRIVTHETGSRRSIATEVLADRLDGPILVGIDASFLDGASPPDPMALLGAAGLDSARTVFNMAADNADVSELGRRRLEASRRSVRGEVTR